MAWAMLLGLLAQPAGVSRGIQELARDLQVSSAAVQTYPFGLRTAKDAVDGIPQYGVSFLPPKESTLRELYFQDKIVTLPEDRRQLVSKDSYQTCKLDRDAVLAQGMFTRLSECACGEQPNQETSEPGATDSPTGREHVRCNRLHLPHVKPLMDENWGVGSQLNGLTKPFLTAFTNGVTFLDPRYDRPECKARDLPFSTCLGMKPLDNCAKRVGGQDLRQEPRLIMANSTGPYSASIDPLVPKRFRHKGLFWWISQVMARILRPDDELLQHVLRTKKSMKWLPTDRVLAVHVRRADVCLVDHSNLGMGYATGAVDPWHGRKCDSIFAFAPHARELIQAHGYNKVFLATDDQETVELGLSKSKTIFGLPRKSVMVTPANRSMYKLGVYYDNAIFQGLLSPKDTAVDARQTLIDLLLLASADGLVGKFTSSMDRVALPLANAWRGGNCIIPYVSLDSLWCADFGRNTGKSVVNGEEKLFPC